MKILDVDARLTDSVGQLAIHRVQEVPQWFIDQLRDLKHRKHNEREGEFMLVASVPVIVHEEWLRDGFDMTREPYKATLKRLRSLSLDAFIATDKRI